MNICFFFSVIIIYSYNISKIFNNWVSHLLKEKKEKFLIDTFADFRHLRSQNY